MFKLKSNDTDTIHNFIFSDVRKFTKRFLKICQNRKYHNFIVPCEPTVIFFLLTTLRYKLLKCFLRAFGRIMGAHFLTRPLQFNLLCYGLHTDRDFLKINKKKIVLSIHFQQPSLVYFNIIFLCIKLLLVAYSQLINQVQTSRKPPSNMVGTYVTLRKK